MIENKTNGGISRHLAGKNLELEFENWLLKQGFTESEHCPFPKTFEAQVKSRSSVFLGSNCIVDFVVNAAGKPFVVEVKHLNYSGSVTGSVLKIVEEAKGRELETVILIEGKGWTKPVRGYLSKAVNSGHIACVIEMEHIAEWAENFCNGDLNAIKQACLKHIKQPVRQLFLAL